MSGQHMNIDRLSSDFEIPKSTWIVTYADIMTIILTFFILLLSMSTIAQTKYEMLVQAFTGDKAGNLMEVEEQIKEVIEEQGLAGEVETKLDMEGLKVSFSNALLFSSGDATLTSKAYGALNPIKAHLVKKLGDAYGVIIEGYTDDVPISNARFASNWELSTSRAISVMNLMIEGGLDRRRVSVQGFAETRSATDVDLTSVQAREELAPEALEEARAANRRVVLRIDALNPELLREVMARGGWRQPSEATSSAPALNTTPQEGGALKEGLLNPVPSDQAPTTKAPKRAKRSKTRTKRKRKSTRKSTRKRQSKSKRKTRRAKRRTQKERK